MFTCGIINAKYGRCGEDCSVCAQSARHRASCDTLCNHSLGSFMTKKVAKPFRASRLALGRGLDPAQASARIETPAFRPGSGLYPADTPGSQTTKE